MMNTLYDIWALLLKPFNKLVITACLLTIIPLSGIYCQKLSSTEGTSVISKSESGTKPTPEYDQLLDKVKILLHSNPDSARLIANNMLAGVNNSEVEKKVRIFSLIGATYHVQANYGNATDFFFKALALASTLEDNSLKADVYNNLGNVNTKIGNYKEALNYLNEAINIYDSKSLERNKASALNNMGLVYMKIKNYNKAKECFIKARKGFTELGSKPGISAALGNIALLHSQEKVYDSALYYFNKSLEVDRQINNKYGLCITLQGMGNMFSDIGNEQEKALAYYKKSKSIAQQIKQPYQEAFANLGIARVLTKQNEVDEAFDLTNKAILIAKTIDNQLLASECREVLSLVYEAAGDYKNSLKEYRKFIELKENVVSQTIFHQIYNQEIANLSEMNQEKQFEIRRQSLELKHKNSMMLFIILAALFIVTGLYLYYRDYKHRQNAKLQEALMKLNEKKSRAAIEAEIQERNRIGQELHDSLGQMLSVARLNISVLKDKTSLSQERRQSILESTLQSVDEAFYELRDISHNLAAAGLTRTGLVNAINNLATQVNQSNRLKMDVEIFGVETLSDSLVENSLYRAVQELLNNTIKHSGATTFSVQLIESETEITLMAEDNGCGFDPKEASLINGGLHILKSRVENINGSLFIDSNENHGTTISIVIPKNTITHESTTHKSTYN